ncbi:MAG TPA: alpha/beta hydrolase [Candidatus Binataceae bacterium]|nr:alpha/beta hydrolase [Candidatus Binataceae bacterium]
MEASVFWLSAVNHPWPRAELGEGKPVLLIPGFMASDLTLAPMAAFMRWLGHSTDYAGIWVNSDCPRETIERASVRLKKMHREHGARVVIVGQSLGGLYARELSHRHPELIERVITLGSPVKLPRHTSHVAVAAVARSMAVLRGKEKGCLTESCACGIRIHHRMPEVPTTVVYSRTDGIAHWESCVDPTGSELVENVEVMSSHCGMAVNPDVYRIISDRLSIEARSRSPHLHAVTAAPN